jgi:antitoxin VapB
MVDMGLNLKNEETEQLIHRLAQATGESLTTAVTIAVRERLDRLEQAERTPLAERLLAIGRDCAPRLKPPFSTVEHGDLLYDEKGLPK